MARDGTPLVLKTLLRVGTVSALLLGCYFGYVRAFDTIVRQFRAERPDNDLLFPARNSQSKQHAKDLARRAVGPDHWAVTSDLPYSYYNAERGFWMFAQEVKEIQEENGVRYDGRRLKMWPFLMIWTSADDKNDRVLTAERATIDLNQPIGLGNKPNNEGIKVKHAYIEGDVRIRDDRGTPAVAADDLRIGPLTYLEFDDETRQITSESHVIIQDPEQTITGDGLVIQLRKPEAGEAEAKSSSSGFGGVEYAILQKTVRVAMRDVGSSGVLPGSGPRAARKTTTPAKAMDIVVDPNSKEPGTKEARSPSGAEPIPLILLSEGPMRIDVPPDREPVAVGPPEPPAPTLVRFERNVVALHGRVDPNQLNCDTLRLTLVPGPQPSARTREDRASRKAAGTGRPTAAGDAPGAATPAESARVAADTGPAPGAGPSGDPKAANPAGPGDASAQAQEPSDQPNKGLFGNLTLQKAHATGHAVWLQMRAQGTKVRCSEMIHERCMPYRPDFTLFRGDRTRQVWMEKFDYEPDEPTNESREEAGRLAQSETSPRRARQVRSVTHVMTVTATIYDRGNGMDLADVRADGPGRLESRPDPKEPVERIAVWQDELLIVNVLGADGQLQQKQVTLTGTRPFFQDLTRNTTLDAGREIKVFLKPRPSPRPNPASVAAAQGVTDPRLATHVAAKPSGADPGGDAFATGDKGTAPGADAGATSGLGGSLQIERLLAYQDVHLVAPNRRMEAREWLDAPFIEVDPAPAKEEPAAAKTEDSAARGPATEDTSSPDSTEGAPQAEDPAKAPATGAVASRNPETRTPAEPAMTGVADRIWAKVALPRGKGIEAGKPRRRKEQGTPRGAGEGSAVAAPDAQASGSPPATAAPDSKEAEAEVREAWLRGNVALHQDPPADPNKKDQAQPQGSDICGEAVYLDNKGQGKASVRVYHRDPTNPTPLPGPIRWAKVSTDDMIVFGEILWMDQEKDKIWAFGPGTLNQWTDRGVLSDKAPDSRPAGAGSGSPPAAAAAGAPTSGVDTVSPPKPRTRAGRPIGDKDLLTITWTKQMEFTGRTKDPSGNSAARVDFLGIVDAKMTDATLHCEQKMIVFTDREVPLAQLGSPAGGAPRRGARAAEASVLPDGDENADREGPARSKVDIALIYCFGKPTAISRKVDPDLPIVLEQERIDAWVEDRPAKVERLDYNRRTGEFFVPGPGMVFLYDRPADKDQEGGHGEAPGDAPGSGAAARGGPRSANGRTVTPTSTRSPNRATGGSSTTVRDATLTRRPGTPAVRRTIPALVLMQVKFSNGMKGRVGAGRGDDTNQERWSEFYGNIEFLRSKVRDSALYHPGRQEVLSPDQRLSDDGFYLTSQMLRIIQEPPPAGSPDKTPARNWAKAWDKVHINKGESISIEADVTTYDSATDLIWAYGEEEHGVTLVQQAGPGQQASVSHGKAVQYNIKTRTGRSIGSDVINLIDKRTGTRPANLAPPDPTAQPKKKGRMPYKVPNTNLERRGFTGY